MNELASTTPANTYKAHAFRRGMPGVTRGELFLKPGEMLFAYADGALDLNFSAVRLRLGGTNTDQLFFEDPNHPDWTIYTNDLSVLKDPHLAGRADLRPELSKVTEQQKRWSWLLTVVAIGFLVLLGIVGLALSQKSRMVRAIATRIPISWEEDLGDKLYEQVKQSSKMVESDNADLDFVRERLLPVVTNSGFKFRFHVIEDKSINAFAIPGGHVFIHTGLLKAVGRPEELAGVLAHEIAHVTQRHAFRKLIESSGLYLVVQYFLGDATGIMAAIGNSSELLLKQKYSRDFEREADDVGWNYLVQAKIDPRGMLDFFQKLKAEEAKLPAGSGPGWDLLSTHPRRA